MRVALINSRLSYFGGLETRLLNYIRFFSEKGDEVFVIAHKIDKKIKLPENTTLVKINIRWFPKRYRRLLFNNRVKKYMKKNRFDFSLSLGRTSSQDAVLAPSNHLGYLKAMKKNRYTFNDRQQIYLDRISYEKSKLVFACSSMMKDELVNLYNIPAHKIKILYPPLNINKFNMDLSNDREQIRLEYGMKNDQKIFVFISTGHKRKGLDLLLNIFEKLEYTNNILFIAGNPAVHSKCENIKYLGYVKETNRLYTAADFTIHPALYEPFGQIISESLACGTPVIISTMVGAKEILNPEIGKVINGFDVETWKNEIINLNRSNFKIPKNIAEQYSLSTQNHIEKMLEYWQDLYTNDKIR